MKIAIIGAGVSGLACAYELQSYGITPTIFEKSDYIGDSLAYSLIWPRIFNRLKLDPIIYFEKMYQLRLQPLNKLNKMIMISPKKKYL